MESYSESPEDIHKIHGDQRSGAVVMYPEQSMHIQDETASRDMLTSE